MPLNLTNRFLGSALLVLLMGIAALPASASVQGAEPQEKVAFGIRPVTANPLVPESFTYFLHTIDPGSALVDEAKVINDGTAPIQLDLYVADARTAINGGTSFANTSVTSSEAASWVTVDANRVSLQPGEQQIVEFTIDVPAETSPGQYIAGLVVQPNADEVKAADGEGTEFGAKVVHRVGIAVVIEVPGPAVVDLSFSDLKIRDVDDEGTTLSYAVVNTGSVMVQGSGTFTITDPDGGEVAAIAFEMDTVLPGDDGLFLLPYDGLLEDGEYQLWATLDYHPVLTPQPVKTTEIGPIQALIIGGKPADASGGYPELEPETAVPQPVSVSSEESSSSPPVLLFVAVGLGLVLIGAVALLVRDQYGDRLSGPRRERRSRPGKFVQLPLDSEAIQRPTRAPNTAPDPFLPLET